MDSGRSSDIDMPLNIAVDSDEEDTSGIISDDEDTPDIEVHEENDVPHPKNQADLATWLKLSDDYLAGLQTNPVPLHRGSYHSRKVGKGVSVRRGQELKKIERERQAREDREDAHHRVKKTQIINFFSTLAKPSPRETDTVDAASNNEDGVVADVESDVEFCDDPILNSESNQLQADSSGAGAERSSIPPPPIQASSPRARVTIEVVVDSDDENGSISVEPYQLDGIALAEEGLDDLPWDPSEERSPRPHEAPAETLPLPTPMPMPDPPPRTLPPGSATYFHHEKGFTMPNRPQPRKLPKPVPSNSAVDTAINSLQARLHPKRGVGRGHKNNDLDLVTAARLECMVRFLRLYKASGYEGWTLHSESVATASGKSGSKTWLGRKIREWCIDFCADNKKIPSHMYGRFNSSILLDEDIAGDIHIHLQSLGKWVTAKDIVRYVATPEFQARLRIKRKISICTAQRWMKKMGYRWKREPKGMYSDGHEREDVVAYRQNVFLPQWKALEARTRWWDNNHSDKWINFDAEMRAYFGPGSDGRIVVIWRHDESTFYAHDRRDVRWVHETEHASIKSKGEGASQMVGDFVSPDYGWLRSKAPDANG
ncbi:hypothetical protein DFH08DRAFT_1050065 [Mycena albidolilacea]|uniref:Uncharacterized protein n=1 Tax=Mycena albidolilacea TaxID=1033008 RepID=A0AAD7EB88_9AGAR|nr:hypothetical protein DFH08DRAFT_1050065 [Mycena albidolilacea]